MTCALVFKVNADTRLSPTEKVVFTNIAGGYQTRSEIARVSGCAESSVPRAVRKLEGYGYLKREFVEGKANKYVLQGAADTGISQDTGINKPTPSADTGILPDTGVHPSTDTPLKAVIHSPHIEHAPARGEDNLLRLEINNNYNDDGAIEVLPPTKVLNGSARGMPAQQLADVLATRANSSFLDPNRIDGLRTTSGRIHRWMEAGADFDADILPTVVRLMLNKRSPVRSWGYFDDAVREATAKRLASEAPMQIITVNEATTNERAYATRGPTGIKRKSHSYIDDLVQGMRGGPSDTQR